jgi:hypothetical protein
VDVHAGGSVEGYVKNVERVLARPPASRQKATWWSSDARVGR